MGLTSASLIIATNTLLQLVFKTFPLLSYMGYFQTKYYIWPVIVLMFWQCDNCFKCTVFTINTDCKLTIKHSNQNNTVINLTSYCCGPECQKENAHLLLVLTVKESTPWASVWSKTLKDWVYLKLATVKMLQYYILNMITSWPCSQTNPSFKRWVF